MTLAADGKRIGWSHWRRETTHIIPLRLSRLKRRVLPREALLIHQQEQSLTMQTHYCLLHQEARAPTKTGGAEANATGGGPCDGGTGGPVKPPLAVDAPPWTGAAA